MRKLWNILWLLPLLLLPSCFKDENFSPVTPSEDAQSRSTQPERLPTEDTRHVMIMVLGAYNSLSGWLTDDLNDLTNGYLPMGKSRTEDALVILSRFPESYGDYTTPAAPVLYRMYSSLQGTPVRDTLKVWSSEQALCSADSLNEALRIVADKIPAAGYGMVFSSHASGWLPAGYYNDPAAYERSHAPAAKRGKARSWTAPESFPPLEPFPAVKSLGQDRGSNSASYEMEMDDFVAAIPYRMEYVLLDACLSGCVEVAWALRDKADVVGFSQAEVLADGFDYATITQRLLGGEPDPISVCEDYFQFYDTQEGTNRSATISVVAPGKMDRLCAVCSRLFEKYRDKIASLSGNSVQGYFRSERHYFYDLQDILVKAGITQEEQAELQAALDECVLYKAATPSFLSFRIRTYCGFSMYLPSMGTDLLDSFYKEHISWNSATHLVN